MGLTLPTPAGRLPGGCCHNRPVPLPIIEPMLASTAAPSRPGEWMVEPKLDGWRALVYVDSKVRVRSRRGSNLTPYVPALQGLRESLGGVSAILDGELVAMDGTADAF